MANSLRLILIKVISLACLIILGPWHADASRRQPIGGQARTLQAVRTHTPPRIDGKPDEPQWQKAHIAEGFLQYEPHNDREAGFDTRVKLLYDDEAIYIAAILYDTAPDSILRELGLRDSGDQLNADRFWVDINPFNDGVNGFRFQVSASGVQTDINMSGAGTGRGDRNWDAVWTSAVGIHQQGWTVEMRIPYSALRFPRSEVHQWGINFWREIRRTREVSSWNFVNRRIGDALASMGVLEGLEGIRPPLRLAFYPYVSGYAEHSEAGGGWSRSLHGGMDVKWGISPSFTMDMTLVPDFGQVQSDAHVLNLTPFEVRYDENRQFFTEGTELFSKGDLLYTRRIGSRPRGYMAVREQRNEHEIIRDNPIETRMINATKISGRTSSGLGLGLFNAMTAASQASLLDTLSGESRLITTQPFTNYNLVVIDQSLRNNSYISLANTNVSGSAAGYTANVSGTEFRLLDRSNMFRISGSAALSQQYMADSDNVFGHRYQLSLGKTGGTWQYQYGRNQISDTYDQNDMGFLRRNNQVVDNLSLSYTIFDPFWRLWNFSTGLTAEYSRLFNPRNFTGMVLGYNARALFDTRFFLNLRAGYHPLGRRDYFEPRVPGRYYKTDPEWNVSLGYSSDYRRRVYIDGSFSYARITSPFLQQHYEIDFRPTFRASDQLNIALGVNYREGIDEVGYVRHVLPDTAYFGIRQTPTLTHSLRSAYIFSNRLSVSFNLRHYWSRAIYNEQFYLLQADGSLNPANNPLPVDDINYNAFTIDMLLTWDFAPGSQMTLGWKNVIDSRRSNIPDHFFENLNHTLNEPQLNSFSVKLLYYIDYQSLFRG